IANGIDFCSAVRRKREKEEAERKDFTGDVDAPCSAELNEDGDHCINVCDSDLMGGMQRRQSKGLARLIACGGLALAEKLVPVEIYSGEARTTNYRPKFDLPCRTDVSPWPLERVGKAPAWLDCGGPHADWCEGDCAGPHEDGSDAAAVADGSGTAHHPARARHPRAGLQTCVPERRTTLSNNTTSKIVLQLRRWLTMATIGSNVRVHPRAVPSFSSGAADFDRYHKSSFSTRLLNFYLHHPICHERGIVFGMMDKICLLSHLRYHQKNFIRGYSCFVRQWAHSSRQSG
ncbi:hypothetical protein ALC57_10961, partial [Trachymyrmex cornetzi]